MEEQVKFVPGICPKCGGQLKVDPSQEAAVCEYCGTPFVVQKAINQYNVQNAKIDHVDNLTVDLKGSVDSILDFAGKEFDKNREDKRESKRIEAENSREFMRNAWKFFAILFGSAIVMWIIGNLMHWFE
jgi:hypothetical protein